MMKKLVRAKLNMFTHALQVLCRSFWQCFVPANVQ